MKRSELQVLVLVLLGLAVTGFVGIVPALADAKMLTVPDQYLTIQSAIDNASVGDTVFVKAGTYYETLVLDKSLALIGEDKNTTIINANYAVATLIDVKASDVTIAGFTVTNCSGYTAPVPQPNGITLQSSMNCNISNNIICGIRYGNGISLEPSLTSALVKPSNNIIAGNYITNCGASGIHVSGGSVNLIQENTVVNNSFGVSLDDESHNNTIVGNYLANSTYNYGLQLNRCSNNTVIENTFTYNHFGVAVAPSANNTFYHNTFIANDLHVLLYGNMDNWRGLFNCWDNGSEGNYWSDYMAKYPNASEIDSTGIGNTAYPIVANGDDSVIYKDNYPLFRELAVPEFPTWVILPLLAVAAAAFIVLKKKRPTAFPSSVKSACVGFSFSFFNNSLSKRAFFTSFSVVYSDSAGQVGYLFIRKFHRNYFRERLQCAERRVC